MRRQNWPPIFSPAPTTQALGVPTIVLRMCNLSGPFDFNCDYRLIPKAFHNIFRDGVGPELYQEEARDIEPDSRLAQMEWNRDLQTALFYEWYF